MTKKVELLEELRKLDVQIQVLREKEGPTPEDVVTLNSLCDQVEEIDAQLKVEERAAAINERNQAPAADPPAGLEEPAAQVRQGFEFDKEGSEEDQARSFGEMLQSVARAALPVGQEIAGKSCGMIDHRLIAPPVELRATGMEEAAPSLGGFLIQKEFGSLLTTKIHQTAILWNRVPKVTIGAGKNGLKIPFLDETSRANGSRLGGIRVYRLEEAGTKTASTTKFGLMEWSLKKLIGLIYSTDELLEDAAALGAIIRDGFGQEFGFKLDDEVLNGTGSGQLVGILKGACLVTVPKETGQTAKTIIWDNIQKMWSRMWPPSLPKAVWLINQSCWTQLMSMTIPVGTGGIPVWLPANLAQGQPNSTLMGRPVLVVEQAETLGTKGDIVLADFSQYLAIEKGGLQTASSIHVLFTTDETAFRFVMRNDGQPTWNSALTPYKDATVTKTLSPFVALATRS